MPPVTVNLDGRLVAPEAAAISIFDHGFLFGDSVYEVVRTHRGIPFTCAEHLERLGRSAARIGLAIPLSPIALTERLADTLRAAALPEAYARIVITRGTGEIDIDPSSCHDPTVLLLVKPLPVYPEAYYSTGIEVHLCGIERTSRRATDPGIKSGNYLNSVLAIMEARKRGAFEGIMKNGEGHLTEGTTSNVFFVKDGALHTPSPECGILMGITRSLVLALAREAGIEVREGSYPPEALTSADEAFITSTTRGVMPVSTVDRAPIAGGKPGPVTRALMERLARTLEDRTRARDLDEFLAGERRRPGAGSWA